MFFSEVLLKASSWYASHLLNPRENSGSFLFQSTIWISARENPVNIFIASLPTEPISDACKVDLRFLICSHPILRLPCIVEPSLVASVYEDSCVLPSNGGRKLMFLGKSKLEMLTPFSPCNTHRFPSFFFATHYIEPAALLG